MERHGLAPDDPKQFETFYAIESLNFELGRPSIPSGEPLDLAFLSTVLLEAARLPLDGVFRARAALMTECCSTYFANPSPIKPGIHRALLDAGLWQGHCLPRLVHALLKVRIEGPVAKNSGATDCLL